MKLIIAILILLIGCTLQKKVESKDASSDDFSYFELKDTIRINILHYRLAGCNCGVRACSSFCIGVRDNSDTIIVLSLCNNDSTITDGMKVYVIPEKKPDYYVFIPDYIIGNNTGKPFMQVDTKRFKATYGVLRKSL